MKIQFLIPQYQETDSIIKPLLDSIAIQQNISMDDIGVIICNDGSNIFLSNELLNSYPFLIEYHKEPHRGVSGTRNACLDYATAEYVMFCDADDMFCHNVGLWSIFNDIEMNGEFDSLVSTFLEETRNPETKKPDYIPREMDTTFVHGKIHRRQYLLDKNIRWNEKLTIHEDSYFNILCQNLSENVKYCPMPFYLWKWRDESVCRHDPKYMLKTFNNFIDSNDALIDELILRNLKDKAMTFSVMMIFDSYYTMNKPEWIEQENQEYRHDTEKRFATYFAKHKHFWDDISAREKMEISNGVRTRCVMEGMQMEIATIDDWLKHIKEL